VDLVVRKELAVTLSLLIVPSPLGPLGLVARGDELAAVHLPDRPGPEIPRRETPVLALAARQLTEYFAGNRRVFDLPLAPVGTAFQRLVWTALLSISYGETRSYGEVARAIGRPRASRAVGAANAKNPIAIIVPCHRVIGASRELTGYAGGMAMKRWLLDHEGYTSFQPAMTGQPVNPNTSY
jgi:methylated-DNA-[protein]-cysteine S-methyltransferase